MSTAELNAGKETPEELRAKGYKRVEIWVPDLTSPQFREAAEKQAERVREAEAADPGFAEFWEELSADALRDAPPYE